MKTMTGVLAVTFIILAGAASAAATTGAATPYWSPGGGLAAVNPVFSYDASTPYGHPQIVEPKGMTAATKARLTNVAQRVDSLIDQHKCADAAALAKNEGGAVMADMATKICALRYSDAK
ncbi:hypothetical protein [Nitrospirillum sp. BR 11163]|uniref:hypothetical protein n=1 Tax=Nitrospirillum sp. BR 11163 TaxID=3104323 RepID=UPI002AFF54B3|nr:hypothetical protein [Nitrospirillum sp. BR 11163]MEA1675100.1 hypothetical protein [Nitrospirillum sp. BR 11163]